MIATRNRQTALIAALAALVILAAATAPAATIARTTRQEVSEGLTCQCGCGLTVANCNHPNCSFAVPLREKIDAMIAKGMTRAQIIAFFRAQYGEKILSAPTTQGFNLLAWIMPPIVLLFGLGAVLLTIARRRRLQSEPQPVEDTPVHGVAAHDPELRRRFERELKERL